jgi:hypothetical protein
MMLDESFLNKQKSQRVRDILNYLNGFFSSFPSLQPYLERVDGIRGGKKINYRLSEYTIFAIRIRVSKTPIFSAYVRDPQQILKDKRVRASGGEQFETKGYRVFDFNDTNADVEFAKEQIRRVIKFYSSAQ